MSASKYNFTMDQGTDCILILTCKDEDGNLIDLTGCSAAMMVRENWDDAEPLVSISSPDDGIAIGGAAGTITATISHPVTSEFLPETVVYDIKLTDSLGNVSRLLEGSITISPAVTR